MSTTSRLFQIPDGVLASGLAATLYLTVYDSEGNVIIDRSNDDITEVAAASTSIYRTNRDVDVSVSGYADWDIGGVIQATGSFEAATVVTGTGTGFAMAASASADSVCVARGDTPALLARIEGRDGNDSSPIVQSDVSSIRYTVVDLDDGDRESVGGTLNKTDVIFNTLQTGAIWTVDDVGFNFLHELPAEAIDQDDHRFVAEYTVELTSGAVKTWSFEIESKKRYAT